MESHQRRGPMAITYFALCTLFLLGGCGDDSVVAPTYSVSGTVSGLSGDLNLALNGAELVTVSGDGAFSFSTALEDAQAYLVTVVGQPDGLFCSIAGGEGEIAGGDVTDVEGTCDVASAELASLEFLDLDAPLSPPFGPTRSFYTMAVPIEVSEVSLVPTAADPTATILVDGVPVPSGTPSAPVSLDLGVTVVFVQVNASNGDSRFHVISVTRGGQILEQIAYGKASNTDIGDYFGSALALSGDTLAVGAYSEDSSATGIDGDQSNNGAPESGAVYVFRRTGSAWAQEAYLKASNSDQNDVFGFSLALSGDTLVVSSGSESSSATGIDGDQTSNSAVRSGAVYVFRRTGTTWNQEAYVKASNAESEDQFGYSLALSGDTLAVGARKERSIATGLGGDQLDNSEFDCGAVYVFVRTGATWVQEEYIKASNTENGDQFGFSLALSGDTLAVGTFSEDSSATGIDGDQTDNSAPGSGAVYVFRRTGAAWQQEAYIKASNTEADDRFGQSLSLSGDTLAVGAKGERSGATGIDSDQTDNSAQASGAVYVFRRTGATWDQEAYVKASNAEAGDQFGSSLALSGDTLAVGASTENSSATGIEGDQADNGAVHSGAVYLFRRIGVTWRQDEYIKASNTESIDQFGFALALSGDTLAVGAYLEDSRATGIGGDQADNSEPDSGAVYLFLQ